MSKKIILIARVSDVDQRQALPGTEAAFGKCMLRNLKCTKSSILNLMKVLTKVLAKSLPN